MATSSALVISVPTTKHCQVIILFAELNIKQIKQLTCEVWQIDFNNPEWNAECKICGF